MKLDSKVGANISSSVGEESDLSTNYGPVQFEKVDEVNISVKEEKVPSVSVSTSASNHGSGSSLVQGEETASDRQDLVVNISSSKANNGRKSSTRLNNSSGKKKVDWTPELHQKFVQAVEQIGVDKAVPSKILELMGIDILTRHNVASHLQKYRSHRKHLQARKADAATRSRRPQLYRATSKTKNNDANSWVVPTTGFPPVASMSHSRPLHVWGHPDQSFAYIWPNHPSASPSPHTWTSSHPWPPGPPPLHGDPSFWYCQHQDFPAPGMPCYTSHFPPTSFTTPPLLGLPPASYSAAPSIGVPITPTLSPPPFDSHLSKESVDSVIGDVLSKPWLPLPLGLKPPSIDSVVVELQRQGISKIPPSCA